MRTRILFFTITVIALFSCKKETEKDPKIDTVIAKSIAAFTCYAKASVSEMGSYEIIDHGFVYSPSGGSFGLESGTKISLGLGTFNTDTFSTVFTFGNGYYSSQYYYVRAYLTNKKGTVYGTALSFEPLLMSISSVQPASGKAGDKITISGKNFNLNPQETLVKFNTTAAKVIEASSTKLVVEVPSGITMDYYYDSTITIYVTIGGQTLNSSSFTILPTITGFSPTSGTFGTTVTITGENLSGYGLSVKFNILDSYVSSVSSSTITSSIPYGINLEKVKVKVIKNGVETILPGEFTMMQSSITSISPAKGFAGTQISINGLGFNPGYSSNIVKIGGVTVSNWSSSQNILNITVPESLAAGIYNIEVNNGISNVVLSNSFTVVTPIISSLSPSTGYYGSEVTIYGENLINTSYIYFGNYGADIVSRDSSSIKVKVPSGITPGATKLSVNYGNKTYSSTVEFTILAPIITSFSPVSGTPGTEVTIKGNGFSSGYYNSSEVKFGTVSTTVVSVTPTEIKTMVPSNAGDGAMKIAVVTSGITVVSDADFTITK